MRLTKIIRMRLRKCC